MSAAFDLLFDAFKITTSPPNKYPPAMMVDIDDHYFYALQKQY